MALFLCSNFLTLRARKISLSTKAKLNKLLLIDPAGLTPCPADIFFKLNTVLSVYNGGSNMSNNNIAKEKFEEGMADFVSQNYVRSI